jgi:transcriptional regulator with XRE-family HTH domain
LKTSRLLVALTAIQLLAELRKRNARHGCSGGRFCLIRPYAASPSRRAHCRNLSLNLASDFGNIVPMYTSVIDFYVQLAGSGNEMVRQDAINLYIGQKLYEIRRQAGRSRIDVAAAIGVEPERLREFETGGERVPAAVLLRLSKVLHIDVLAFFRGLPTKDPAPGASVAIVSETTEEAEATALLRDFSRIHDQRARQLILSLVAGYAENENAQEY